MGEPKAPPGLVACLLRGSLGFGAVSVAAYSIWAFGAGRVLGEKGMYAAVAAVFVVLSGAVLHPLAGGWLRFLRSFVPGFLAYAAVWCLAWFQLKAGKGEWLGSAGGSLAFALVAGGALGAWRAVLPAALVLFLTHSAGYFLGGELYYATKKSAPILAMLGWGLLYGLGFGAGIGTAYHAFRK
jgi:hypothetical protein